MATIVLKLGGSVCLDAGQVAAVAGEIKALTAAGHQVVVVHGGGPQLDDALKALGEPVVKLDGLRVTSKPAANVVLDVMDAIGADLTNQLNAHGIKAQQVRGVAESFEASPKKSEKGDLGRVGTVRRFTAAKRLHGAREVHVVTPVGFDAQGPLNVNADEGASAVAQAMRATWLILATDVEAVRGAQGEAVAKLSPRQARQMIVANTATGGMIPKLTAAVAALAAGVRKVLITKIQPGLLRAAVVDGKASGTLLENDMELAF